MTTSAQSTLPQQMQPLPQIILSHSVSAIHTAAATPQTNQHSTKRLYNFLSQHVQALPSNSSKSQQSTAQMSKFHTASLSAMSNKINPQQTIDSTPINNNNNSDEDETLSLKPSIQQIQSTISFYKQLKKLRETQRGLEFERKFREQFEETRTRLLFDRTHIQRFSNHSRKRLQVQQELQHQQHQSLEVPIQPHSKQNESSSTNLSSVGDCSLNNGGKKVLFYQHHVNFQTRKDTHINNLLTNLSTQGAAGSLDQPFQRRILPYHNRSFSDKNIDSSPFCHRQLVTGGGGGALDEKKASYFSMQSPLLHKLKRKNTSTIRNIKIIHRSQDEILEEDAKKATQLQAGSMTQSTHHKAIFEFLTKKMPSRANSKLVSQNTIVVPTQSISSERIVDVPNVQQTSNQTIQLQLPVVQSPKNGSILQKSHRRINSHTQLINSIHKNNETPNAGSRSPVRLISHKKSSSSSRNIHNTLLQS